MPTVQSVAKRVVGSDVVKALLWVSESLPTVEVGIKR